MELEPISYILIFFLTLQHTFWFACYVCEDGIETSTHHEKPRSPEDGYVFFPNPVEGFRDGQSVQEERSVFRQNRAKSLQSRERFVKGFASKRLQGLKNGFIQARRNGLDKAMTTSDFLKAAEENLGTMSNILNDNEKLDINVDGIGNIALVRHVSAESDRTVG